MSDNTDLLNQIRKIVREENEPIKKDMATKKDVEVAIKASEDRLKKVILDSQEDTIETLKEYIDTAYNMLDKRVEKIEDTLDLPHPDKN
jgi:hypothetical protein